jgi:hypothetical protein
MAASEATTTTTVRAGEAASAAMGLSAATTTAVAATTPGFGQRGAGKEQTRHRHGSYKPDRWAVRAATVCLSHDR